MLKCLRPIVTIVALAGALGAAGCGSCGGGGGGFLHCESPCYGASFHRDARQMMDFVDVYFLNYDRHDPYRCEPCIGD